MKTKVLGIEITNPDKIIYEDLGVKKIDVINYYKEVASLMLPYIKDRPISLIRCHGGVGGECFFKKHPTTEKEFVKTFIKDDKEYFYLNEEKEIVQQAQMGTIEFHTNGATINNLDKPTIMVFDLDPDEKMPLDKLRQGVMFLKEVIDDIGLKSYLKTSGGKGYHIVVPFKECSSWDMFSTFANNVALIAEKKYPKIFTTNIRKDSRKNKIFVDYLRNKQGSTCVSPYSLRARKLGGISMPIKWNDLNKITPTDINILNYKKFLKRVNAWKDFFDIKQKLY